MRRLIRAAGSTGVALLATTVVLLWPAGLGGATTFVTTHGISMEPRFHTGDLAVLRTADSYAVGDVVGYRSATLHTTVMHRIVERDGNRFVFKGDNNTWLDPDHPTADLLIGTLWFRVPAGGTALAQLRSPWTLGALALLGSLVARQLAARGSGRHRRSRRIRNAPPRPRTARARTPRIPLSPRTAQARQTALVAGAVALLVLVGEALLLSLPSTRAGTTSLAVTQDGVFSYAGTATPGATYPTGRFATGDAIYTALARSTTVSFDSTVHATGSLRVGGTLRLDVGIAAADGWHAELGAGDQVTVRAGTTTATAALDIPAALDLLRRHATEIGGGSGGAATLTVTPRGTLTGTLDGHPFSAAAPAALTFTVDGTALRVAAGNASALRSATPTAVVAPAVVPRTFDVRGYSLTVSQARLAAGLLAALALVVAAVAALRGRATRDPVAEFRTRHAARLLTVRTATPGPQVVDVEDAAALFRVAERADAFVLHSTGPGGETFLVLDQGLSYRYVVPPVGPGDASRGEPYEEGRTAPVLVRIA